MGAGAGVVMKGAENACTVPGGKTRATARAAAEARPGRRPVAPDATPTPRLRQHGTGCEASAARRASLRCQAMIVWGTKIKRKVVGWVADFCPLCRGLKAFRLQRIGEAGHLWYISLTSGGFLGNEIECSDCRTLHETNGSRYTSISDGPLEPDELIRRTLPAADARVQALLAREERVKEQQLAPEERMALVREAVAHGAGQMDRLILERRYAPTARVVGWATAGVTLLFALSIDRVPEWVRRVLALLMVAGLFACFYFMVTRVRSHLRRVVEPAVARGLAPLKPTLEEIREAVAYARSLGSSGAKKLKPQRLYDALHTAWPSV